ncbi:hypothetical protein CU048_14475 [Beijerinckiaceae bacterium]|nr:hypothetical protein CU048_14475 [Beijerinckiaceae bacterium]
MSCGDEHIADFSDSRIGTISICTGLTVCGVIFIVFTGRYELSVFIVAALLPWVELWFKRRK